MSTKNSRILVLVLVDEKKTLLSVCFGGYSWVTFPKTLRRLRRFKRLVDV